MAEIIELRSASINDIPAMMRKLADEIEQGHWGKVESMLCVLPVSNSYPVIFGWGEQERENHPVVQLALAQQWFLSNLTKRSV